MKKHVIGAALLAVLAGACGDYSILDPNGPSIDALEEAPRLTSVVNATQGLFIQARRTVEIYAGTAGIFGRETYNLDAANPPNVLGYLVGPLEPGGYGTDFGWTNEYRLLRHGNIVLRALETIGPGMTETQKQGVRGIVKTLQANALINVIRIRDEIGAAVDVDRERSGEPAPIVAKAQVYARILQMLDEARTNLGAAGTTLPITFPPGFADFRTPANFIRFNRALHARANLYLANYAAVLTSLNESFISASPADLQRGAYHSFSSAPGDSPNPLFDPVARVWAIHTSLVTDAQRRADGSVDLRVGRKTAVLPTPRVLQGVSSNLRGTQYATPSDPVPIIKNEELLLMRAEARWFTGDRTGAVADLNVVRTTSGGLAALAVPATDAEFVTALLYERRYSLLFEYGHRWVDMRRFNRLNQLPKAVPNRDRIFPFVPLSIEECTPRTPKPDGCRQIDGI